MGRLRGDAGLVGPVRLRAPDLLVTAPVVLELPVGRDKGRCSTALTEPMPPTPVPALPTRPVLRCLRAPRG